MFTDIATIQVQAGKGGDGRLSFRRSRGNAKGGPDGGDGGIGGNVIMRVDHNTSTLSMYRNNKLWQAHDGQAGGSNNRHGKNGQDIVLSVPAGTVVKLDGETVADLTLDGQEAIVAKGGTGGFGNAHFKSSIRQAPQLAELGESGESFELKLELKLIADVGLVGLPNAGKSTLLSMITGAKPEIADYAFTTLIPNLGVVEYHDNSFLLADIPGLIEGASKGKGLGDEFLRHVERCMVVLHLIDINSPDIVKDYTTIRTELKNYTVDISDKPSLVVLAKTETVPASVVQKQQDLLITKAHVQQQDLLHISAVTTDGLANLIHKTYQLLTQARKKQAAQVIPEDDMPVITVRPEDDWQVERIKKGVYAVSGAKIEGFAKRTNFSQADGVRRLRDILKKMGIAGELVRQGCEQGDTIQIAKRSFKW